MANRKGSIKPFAYDLEDADISRERNKAREIRNSQWWKRIKAKGVCYYCKKYVGAQNITMDHIVPVSRGGASVKSNIVPCCKDCNNKKKNLTAMEFDLG